MKTKKLFSLGDSFAIKLSDSKFRYPVLIGEKRIRKDNFYVFGLLKMISCEINNFSQQKNIEFYSRKIGIGLNSQILNSLQTSEREFEMGRVTFGIENQNFEKLFFPIFQHIENIFVEKNYLEASFAILRHIADLEIIISYIEKESYT